MSIVGVKEWMQRINAFRTTVRARSGNERRCGAELPHNFLSLAARLIFAWHDCSPRRIVGVARCADPRRRVQSRPADLEQCARHAAGRNLEVVPRLHTRASSLRARLQGRGPFSCCIIAQHRYKMRKQTQLELIFHCNKKRHSTDVFT